MYTSLIPQAYDLGRGVRGLDCVDVKDLQVDKARASATGIFASASMDREGDVINIAGIDTSMHRKNPVVLWVHGMDFRSQDGQFPIGVTEDANGQYTVTLLPDKGVAIATTYFTQKTLLGEQVCALVLEKTIRSQSIGFKERKVERLFEDDRYIGNRLVEIEMIETSWCPIPMNGECVRAILAKPVAGKALHPSIKRAFEPYATAAPVWANGFTLGKAHGVKQNDPEAQELQSEEVAATHGEKALRTCAKAVIDCRRKMQAAVAPLDDGVGVKELLTGHCDFMTSILEEHKEAMAENYPDAGEIDETEESGKATTAEAQAHDAAVREALNGKDDEEEDEESKAFAYRLRTLKLKLEHQLRLLNAKNERQAG